MSVAHAGADCIADNGFDILFSVLQNFHRDLPADNKQTAFSILLNVANDLIVQLDQLLTAGKEPSRMRYLKITPCN